MAKKLNTIKFISKAKEIHGDRYDYSKVKYITNKVNISIICHKHGEFLQTPNNHLRGAGCKTCFDLLRPTLKKDNTEKFIKKANIVHNNKYSYDNVDYKYSRVKVNITCHIHGDFSQSQQIIYMVMGVLNVIKVIN